MIPFNGGIYRVIGGNVMRFVRGLLFVSVVLVAVYLAGFYGHWFGSLPGPGEITGEAIPEDVVIARQQARLNVARGLDAPIDKQILFGDLHVHTTYSTDAFLWSLPMAGGEGVHPIGDACDYARYCSGLDFWGITDHAEASTPRRWQEARESIRQCQAISGDTDNPDLVSFIGFEWTQVGNLPTTHYGHKNVIFRELQDDSVAARPIAAAGAASEALREGAQGVPPAIFLTEGLDTSRYLDLNAFLNEVREVPACDPDVPSNELPADCYEIAATPGELVARLEQQELDPLIIPHGSTWGFYTPPGYTLDHQLSPGMRPEAFRLIEIMSGHGNSEEYRPWRAIEGDVEALDALEAAGDLETMVGQCPSPSPGYEPSCWRAGEIMRERCLAAGLGETECEQRAANTREYYANMGVAGHLAVPGADAVDWLNAGQCTDCFLPAFNYRPGGSVQYGLALSNFENGLEAPQRFLWGFIASSDNHRARPGTGYKEVAPEVTLDASGPVNQRWAERIYGEPEEASDEPRFIDRDTLTDRAGFSLLELERQASFFLTGGLAAVHAEGRTRGQIWEALQSREVYGTSGPKIMLWFEMLDGEDRQPMGANLVYNDEPRFRVRAAGAFEQKPGCPEHAERGLTAERVATLCSGECDNPGNERHPITRIEVVRIRPQMTPGEKPEDLIDDPWRVFECPDNPNGCEVTFSDPDYVSAGRDATYYVRAIQAPTPTLNAGQLRCEYDGDGNCIRVNPCHADYRDDPEDDCLTPAEHRAWSSPIYLVRDEARLSDAR